MKTIFLAILLLSLLTNLHGQNDFAIDKSDLPKGLKISIDSAEHTSFMDRKCIGHLTFSNTKKDVSYHVYNYNPKDSLVFKNIKMQRVAMESCNWKGNNSWNRNKHFEMFFLRNNYYFVAEFCTCGASSKGHCGDLAKKINKWLTRY
jgi:hypothetical protein